MQKTVGICIGASTISIAEKIGETVEFSRTHHDGKVASILSGILDEKIPARLGITGRKFRDLVSAPTISEPEAVELAYSSLKDRYKDIDCIVSAGAETFLVYQLDQRGRIRSVQSGNKCASGTGEFFLQQIKRMGLDVEDALDLAETKDAHVLAGRCSVFCKSDCTHALNKGIPKSRISAGLCQMMAGKIIELLKICKGRRILLTGGVSRIPAVVRHLREAYPETLVAEEAPCLEALGALIWAEKNSAVTERNDNLITTTHSSFPSLPALEQALSRVSFKSMPRGEFYDGEYIFGLDVGSTTTKAVLIRTDNHAIVASVYLRTNGDPIQASRRCYQAIADQLPKGLKPQIVGLGTTGSGRQISGLHAMTAGVINEIVAHASAAVFFDPHVETIFEIGGQDAKYTFITNRVASDYAMNEACSAGTGSFLEEACHEALGINTEEIAAFALNSTTPPNFSDQCAAFISSDIKTAVHEGIGKEDIVAGLVYSICQNYLNRVKGNRPVGRKVFMQGGVCYNRAVPAAMAALCQQEVIVPPEPGLMGAFGVALEVHRKISHNLLPKGLYDLNELASREVAYRDPFICSGGREKCDRKCSIARLSIDGTIYPFGGACDMYYNLLRKEEINTGNLDLVKIRENLVFRRYLPTETGKEKASVGIPTSLLTNTLFPLYAHFFNKLGVRVVTSTTPDPSGMEATGAAFCFPVALSHGFVADLLGKDVDFIFVPHVKTLSVETSDETNCTCPFVQAEPYYLQAAFHEKLKPKIITEVLDFDDSKKLVEAFVAIAGQMGFHRKKAIVAFNEARSVFTEMRAEMLEHGRRFLRELKPDEYAMVLFGRPYNAFSKFGNMGIPHKFASRGYKIIPHDFLPLEELGGETINKMFWASGQAIMQAAQYVRCAPNLFGVFITNFSCGPDSFIGGYFRDVMGQKPSLTLELDAHTADAGVDTRIEAFLDVIKGYREICPVDIEEKDDFEPCRLIENGGKYRIRTSDGRDYDITDPDVHMLVPSMGDTASKCLAAAMRFVGVNATALDAPGQMELNLGKGLATCKECLPLMLTAGSLAKYLHERTNEDEIIVYFMPETDGPCRFGQYNVFMENFIRKNRIRNVAILSLSCENSYAGLPKRLSRRAWQAMTISDGLDDVYAALLALASDKGKALRVFEHAKSRIIASIASDSYETLMLVLHEEMLKLSSLAKKKSLQEATRISLVGEIYVRRDGFSRKDIVEKLAGHGMVVRTAPIAEWLYYTDYCVANGISTASSIISKVKVAFKNIFMRKDESMIKKQLELSGFYESHMIDVNHLVTCGAAVMSPELAGEAILTVSSALTEVGDDTHGVISIGPFGCMPCRIAESIVSYRLAQEKPAFSRHNEKFWNRHKDDLPLPFLAIESDGNPFPQLVETRLESLRLSANRLNEELRAMNVQRR